MNGSALRSSRVNDGVREDRQVSLGHKYSFERDTLLVGLISFTYLCLSARTTGVWELSESLQAQLCTWMWEHETWMQVNVPLDQDRVRPVAELAMGWWPTMLSARFLSSMPLFNAELALRLPSIVLASLTLSTFYSMVRAWKVKATTALISVALLMMTPAFGIITRHGLGSGGLGTIACLLACLSIWRSALHESSPIWRILGGLSLILSAGSLGLIGCLPLVVWASMMPPHKPIKEHIKRAIIDLGPALFLISIYAWRSWVKRADGVDAWSLFMVIDPISQTFDYSEWTGFQRSLHLIGFGLFPLGALLPVVAYVLNSRDKELTEGRDADQPLLGRSLVIYLVISFFASALLASSGGYWGGASLLISVPFAVAAALYLTEWRQRALPPPLYTLSVILFWILLHGDLKRDPALIISSLTGESSEGLLPNFTAWRFGKALSSLGLLLVICCKTPFLSGISKIVKSLFASKLRGRNRYLIAVSAILLALLAILPHLFRALPRWVVSSRFVDAPFWGGVSEGLRITTLAIVIAILSYHALSLFWRSVTRSANHHLMSVADLEWGFVLSWLVMTSHYLDRLPIFIFMKPLSDFMEASNAREPNYLNVVLVHLGVIAIISLIIGSLRHIWRNRYVSEAINALKYKLNTVLMSALSPRGKEISLKTSLSFWVLASLIFSHSYLPQSLSAELSHQGILKGYQEHMKEGESLKRYLAKGTEKSYYLSALTEVDKKEFLQLAEEGQRQMFVIDRAQLSRANGEFRKASGRHLPVIDDRHHELLLVTNQLAEGERDFNPIKQAVIDDLPEGVQSLKEPINFENRIELVAWRLTPARPRPGVPLKIDLFWRAKQRVRTHWKVFIHIDAPGQRIHADHEPVLGVYPTEDWQEGDLVVDTHHITVKRNVKPAHFTFFAGLYRGKTRMKIQNKSSAVKGKDNRGILGKIVVR